MGPAHRFTGWLLLLAMISLGAVPQGMMRDTRTDGAWLVLCTADGPQDIWLEAENAPPLQGKDHRTLPHCVQVGIGLGLIWSAPAARPIQMSLWVAPQGGSDQLAERRITRNTRNPRAPPVPV